MARRKNGGLFKDVVSSTALLPWWIGLLLALGSYLLLHGMALDTWREFEVAIESAHRQNSGSQQFLAVAMLSHPRINQRRIIHRAQRHVGLLSLRIPATQKI